MKLEWTTSEIKEMLLVWLALAWGFILVLPGNTFIPSSQINNLGLYAEDWVWGIMLILVSMPMVFANRYRWIRFRKFAHAFYWVFWLGISILLVTRLTASRMDPTDVLLVLPFLTIALLHAIIYTGLGRKL